ncbi:glutamate synthase large subunit [Terricaulis silvestris]|uniref:Glutamate synthase [NADPH] large chain n=1 Tax=Terricaulis silvestris TaxID=2686094 RepID=A0A6I6MGS5_9CAUL|nr:glutamate synthase large subunit [Terricaulis silvestris]QGZ93935.1 Glutamate synthase [NADPH] large chain precursor [Terricaulis silvestris]
MSKRRIHLPPRAGEVPSKARGRGTSPSVSRSALDSSPAGGGAREIARYIAQRAHLESHGLYRADTERDACGVGLVVAIDGKPRRDVVTLALAALKAVWHRGAVDADGKTGDGAGILIDAPQDFFREQVIRTGHTPKDGPIFVGQIFLPRLDLGAQERARVIVESEIIRAGFTLYGWRQVPVNISQIGEKANATRPEIEQVLLYDPQGRDDETVDRDLFIVRRRIEKRALSSNIAELYVCSLSAQTLVYKGMFLAQQIDAFYPDLRDERFVSSVAIYHQRYSTNTFPQWRLAQPFRMLAHNGEINTLKGNVNWMRSHEIPMASDAFGDADADVKPIIQPGGSDSAALDNVFEVLVRAGRSAPMAKSLLIPEAWAKSHTMSAEHKALYAYCNAVMEPWDGPAGLAMFDGRWAVAGLDRNGLRPLRFARTEDGILAVGSETGMCPLDGRKILERGRIGAGQMIAVDTHKGRLYHHDELVDELAQAHPYRSWLDNIVDLDTHLAGDEPRLYADRTELLQRQAAAGFTMEDLELLLQPMMEEGKEAIGSMGDDAPLAVLSEQTRPLSHYFRQNFSQVTNPPIDPLREGRVMTLTTRFKNLGNILAQDETQARVYVLSSPILTNGMFARMMREMRDDVARIDCTFPTPAPGEDAGVALRKALQRVQAEAEQAVGYNKRSHVVLSDENQGPDRIACPMILVTSAVHSHLVAKGLRSFCSLSIRSAECLDPHYAAVLIGCGATTVNPYLALDTISDRASRGLAGALTREQAAANYRAALEAGLLKIISKMGISVISSYRGGLNFEAIGLSRALVDEFFPGLTSRISGIGLGGIAYEAADQHARAHDETLTALPLGGQYRYRASGERHALEANSIHQLQAACDTGDYKAYRKYSEVIRERRLTQPIQLRDLLEVREEKKNPTPIADVEGVTDIRKRFLTPGMSMGALSPEAHGALNIAMNRIGARSVSGEGGEDPARYTPHPNGDDENSAVKQVASGRFGVTAEYLNQCREIEIKVAQGAKPGEGGQLPGFKVTELIARLRHATPGVSLISPPPHHDIYSIEDLAQLIYDLKQINPVARVCVKLVAQSGIGAVAAGVAKAGADTILISGHVGGTGASPQTSIKYAGIPWEMGLSEAHQTLMLNNLRHRVRLRTDGGLRTGRDVVVAAILGAEEFGIGTASLVAMGCLMVRQCHSNTCPVGVCTQDEALRKKFTGTPDKVVNLMTFIAEEVREILAMIGFRRMEDIIGRTDLIEQISRGSEHLDDLDLNPLLVRVDSPYPPYCTQLGRNEPPQALDHDFLTQASAFFERGEKRQLDFNVRNTDRAIGARSSAHVVRRVGQNALAEGTLSVNLNGSCGQSLGAFLVQGIALHVTGDANDYVGKGLSGGLITLKPAPDEAHRLGAIIGNTCLYGATSGQLFAAGLAGERFAVRNSGATTVVEGAGANACEYMTGGTAVILGPVGENFGAGMSGGMAFVYDADGLFEQRANADTIVWQRLASKHWEDVLKTLIEEHVRRTHSPRAADLLAHWSEARTRFWQICPKEMLPRLAHALSDETSSVAAA